MKLGVVFLSLFVLLLLAESLSQPVAGAVAVADDVIRATPRGVAPPIQVAFVTPTEATVLSPPDVRGLGLGARLLREVEAAAVRLGAPSVRLDTNRSLTEAIAMYRARGYVEIPDFNGERYADFWFEKRLG